MTRKSWTTIGVLVATNTTFRGLANDFMFSRETPNVKRGFRHGESAFFEHAVACFGCHQQTTPVRSLLDALGGDYTIRSIEGHLLLEAVERGPEPFRFILSISESADAENPRPRKIEVRNAVFASPYLALSPQHSVARRFFKSPWGW